MDSLIPGSILSVLLQRLPVHRGTANPAPPAQPLPRPCPHWPQHSLNSKSWSKTKHSRQTRGRAVSRTAFPCRRLKSHKSWAAGWVHTSRRSPGGARRSTDLLWVPWRSPPSAASHLQPPWNPFPACPRDFFIPRIQGCVYKF